MPKLPLFLALSVLLHLSAGYFLLWRAAGVVAVAQPGPVTNRQMVVQVALAPLHRTRVAESAALRPSSAPGERAQPAVPRNPVPAAQRVAKQVPQPAPEKRDKLAAKVASAPSAAPSATGKPAAQIAQAPAKAGSSAESPETVLLEIHSRHPAFRLPPQQPRYPAQARRRNQQGVVLLEVRLDERGGQRALKLIQSSGFPSLDQAALEAVADWRFHPETINGKGVPSRVQIPIEFALLASR